MDPWVTLELITDGMPEGPRKRALEGVMNDVLRLQTVARKARWLSLAVIDNAKYVIDTHWAQDIVALTPGMDDYDPAHRQLENGDTPK